MGAQPSNTSKSTLGETKNFRDISYVHNNQSNNAESINARIQHKKIFTLAWKPE